MYRGVGIAYGSLGEDEGWAWMWMSRKGKEDGEVDGREDKYFLGLMHLFEKQVPHFYKRPTNDIPTAARGSPRLAQPGQGGGRSRVPGIEESGVPCRARWRHALRSSGSSVSPRFFLSLRIGTEVVSIL